MLKAFSYSDTGVFYVNVFNVCLIQRGQDIYRERQCSVKDVMLNGLYLYSDFLVFQPCKTFIGAAIRSNEGFSVLPKDTWTCGLEEPGIKLLIFRLVDDLFHRTHRQAASLN